MHKRTLFFTLLVTTILYAGVGQQTQVRDDGGQPPPDFRPAEVMQRHGIALTTQSLVEALRNQDELVRVAAAMELAHRKAIDATPLMVEALNEEKTRKVQMEIAYSLARIGEETGKEAGLIALQSICHDKNAPSRDRLLAARYSLDFKNEGCLGDVIEILEMPQLHDTDFQLQIQGLSLVPRFEHASEDDSKRIRSAAAESMSSPDPTVRMTAADALAKRGDKSAIQTLKGAIAVEQNELVRSSMSGSLNTLEKAH
jgi:HEAT repeat protein